jgi:hypothetical protein
MEHTRHAMGRQDPLDEIHLDEYNTSQDGRVRTRGRRRREGRVAALASMEVECISLWRRREGHGVVGMRRSVDRFVKIELTARWRSWLRPLRGYKPDLVVVGSIPGLPTPQSWYHPPMQGNPR